GLAVVLLAFLFVLTFLGTIEQTELGLFDVQKKYFESLWLVHWIGPVPIPLPGVYLVLMLLGVNLLVGGLVRIQKSRRTVGVIVIHVGIVIMLAAGLVKLKFSNEGHLKLYEKPSLGFQHNRADEYVSYHEWELAIWDAAETKDVTERLVPESDFTDLADKRTRAFEADGLPFK